jgi:hypothetical protein
MQRDKPKKYIDEAIKLFKVMEGKVIVEIGSMRQYCLHSIGDDSLPCCNDGHSSLLWADTGADFYTVDIDPSSFGITKLSLKEFPNAKVINNDGIAFLSTFDKKIDLLFLDAWDVDSPECAENHVKAYYAAEHALADTHLILIDDTDVDSVDNGLVKVPLGTFGGKGRLLIPLLLEQKYKLIPFPWEGNRQVLLGKKL